jgi:hypothetical protein
MLEVLMVVAMKTTASWDMTSCSLVYHYQCLGGTRWLHLQGRKLPVGGYTILLWNLRKPKRNLEDGGVGAYHNTSPGQLSTSAQAAK